ncbi:hypothetical protein ACIP9H_40285 [Streptomyces sp. NPDC088732]|uniref:hypothetical protein n=1 Tax=Streptomyces sp. NPDC088732 TaxID=3365879 RepID=UPI0037F4776D
MTTKTRARRRPGAEPQPLRQPRLDVWLLEPCRRTGCGKEAHAGRTPDGWTRITVGGSGEPPRIYCSGLCATKGIALAEIRTAPKGGTR